MTRLEKLILIISGVLAVLFMVTSLFAIEEVEIPAQNLQEAPGFTMPTYTGETFALSDHGGQVVILSFWASWDNTSYTEAGILQSIHEAYGDEVVIVGVNHFDPVSAALDFIEELELTYVLGPDEAGEIATAYSIDSIPKTIIINSDGFITESIDGLVTESELREKIDLLLGVDTEPEAIIDAPIPPNAIERYADIPQSTTEDGYPVLGSEDALASIENFSSYSCPFCRNFHNQVYSVLLDERIAVGDAMIVYVPIYNTGSIPNGFEANRAALCVAEQGQFWGYTDALFDWHTRFRQEAFSDERLRQGVINMDLDIAAWDDCMASDRPADILETALEMMREREYSGTPTIVINGEVVTATLSQIQAFLDELLGERI